MPVLAPSSHPHPILPPSRSPALLPPLVAEGSNVIVVFDVRDDHDRELCVRIRFQHVVRQVLACVRKTAVLTGESREFM